MTAGSRRTAEARPPAAGAAPFAHLLAAMRGRAAAGARAGGPPCPPALGESAGELGAGGARPTAMSSAGGRRDLAGEGEAEEASASVAPSDPALAGAADEGLDRPARQLAESDWLDPSARHLAQLAAPGTLGNPLDLVSAAAIAPLRVRSLEELLPALVRRVAWAGDARRGTVRLELAGGAYAGAIVTVHAEGGRVRVEVGGHEGPDLERLRGRLDARLRGHGLDVESVT